MNIFINGFFNNMTIIQVLGLTHDISEKNENWLTLMYSRMHNVQYAEFSVTVCHLYKLA